MTDPKMPPEKRLHVVIGTPDPDHCPICRAHAKALMEDRIPGQEAGAILLGELSVSEMLRCPCPLCKEARRAESGE
jgi:hypothetical protein